MSADVEAIGPLPEPFRCGVPGCQLTLGHDGKHKNESITWSQPAPLSESASVPQQSVQSAVGVDSPSAVEAHEAALTVEWARLSDLRSTLKTLDATYAEQHRQHLESYAQMRTSNRTQRQEVTAEMERIERLLRAHKRLREPVRRRK